jgi:hypothetical protein
MHSAIKTLFAVLPVLAFAACSDSTGVNGDVTGSYTLSAVNGSQVPMTAFQDATYTLRINSGNINLNSDGTFTETISYTETFSGTTNPQTTSTCLGTYTRSGSSIFFDEPTSSNPDCGGTYSGNWNGSNQLAVNFNAGITAVFTR